MEEARIFCRRLLFGSNPPLSISRSDADRTTTVLLSLYSTFLSLVWDVFVGRGEILTRLMEDEQRWSQNKTTEKK